MKKLTSLMLMLTLSMAVVAFPSPQSQDPAKPQEISSSLTNKDILEMLKAGLTAEIVIAKIKSSPANFDTTPPALAELKTANVPDSIILAMVNRPAAGAADVPDGTEVEIQLTNNVSGEELKVGDFVDFVIIKPVLINGVTVFEKDAAGRARITTAKRAGYWGKAGKLEWAMQDLLAADGNRIPARFTQRKVGASKGGRVAIAAVATTVFLGPFLGPIGLLWGFKRGKPAIIPAGNRYRVFVHGDTKIKGKPVEASTQS
jgi:hypothetical protein